jgi:hypothetical protein
MTTFETQMIQCDEASAQRSGRLANVAGSAAFVRERLSWPTSSSAGSQGDAIQGQRYMDLWCERNGDALKKRLLWDGVTPAGVQRRLETAVPPAGWRSSSAWLEALNDIVETGKSFQPERHTLPVHPERPIPFEDCLLPAVIVGRATLANRCRENGEEQSFVYPEAQLAQERGLLHKLAVLCAPTLMFEFERQQPFGAMLLQRLEDKEPSGIKASDHRYRSFVERLLRDGGLSLFETYPVLGRLVATSVMAWVECSAELLQRLSADAAELSIRFADGQALGQVSTLKTSLSDPHRGGRTVAVPGFTSGCGSCTNRRSWGWSKHSSTCCGGATSICKTSRSG